MFECTKDMENITLSPSAVTKLKTRKSANKIRHGSPKLQEVLRERCRKRMREKRGQLFNRSRFGLEINSRDVQGTLTEIVRSELSNLASIDLDPELNPFSPITNQPLNPEEAFELETEILKEEEEWILQEYERMSQDEIELLSTIADQGVDDVICPKCQKSNLIQKENKVACKTCEFTLNNCISLEQIGYLISRSVDIHSAYCKEPPGFLSVPENNIMSLYLICDKCSAWTHII